MKLFRLLLYGNFWVKNPKDVVSRGLMKNMEINQKIFRTLFFGLVVILSGCVSPARIDKAPLRENISIHDVIGGSVTPPVWISRASSVGFKTALENSLKAVDMFAPSEIGKYKLTVHLEELKQSILGSSMTGSAKINYSLSVEQTGKEIYNKTINLPYTVKLGDVILGSERLRLANEGVIRVNIKRFIDDLFEFEKMCRLINY